MFWRKDRNQYEDPADVEMRDQSCTRDDSNETSLNCPSKNNLMKQFFHSDNPEPHLKKFINFSDSEEDSPKSSGAIFAKPKSISQNNENDVDELREKRRKKRESQLNKPLYTTRQFSFNEAYYNPNSQPKHTEELPNIPDEEEMEIIACKRNLFAEEGENVDPNFDSMMQFSPERDKKKVKAFVENPNVGNDNKFNETVQPRNFLQEWHSKDSRFKSKYSSGTTPKFERKVIKGLKIKSKFYKNKKIEAGYGKSTPNIKKFGGISTNFEQDEQERRKNPFLQITPQMNRKVRKCSFDNQNMILDFSSPTKTKKLTCETPAPAKSYGRVRKYLEESESKDGTPDKYGFENFNDRGTQFKEDFDEIWNLGQGHFGSVVKCQNKFDGIEYAIKITEKPHPKKRPNIHEALQEAFALAALSVSSENPYIVRYYRAWIENEQLYIQMELCENSLYDIFKENQMSEKEILIILRDVCLGLKELHQKGIVHLDLKLENILKGTSGKFKLGDLGLSRLVDKLKNDVPEGDSRYLAQELLNNDPNAPLPDLRKCDVFSLGILTYELMEGRRVSPNGDEWHNLRENRISFTYPTEYSDKLKLMVCSMLNPNPAMRPSIEDLLNTNLKSDEEKELDYCRLLWKTLLKMYMKQFTNQI